MCTNTWTTASTALLKLGNITKPSGQHVSFLTILRFRGGRRQSWRLAYRHVEHKPTTTDACGHAGVLAGAIPCQLSVFLALKVHHVAENCREVEEKFTKTWKLCQFANIAWAHQLYLNTSITNATRISCSLHAVLYISSRLCHISLCLYIFCFQEYENQV